MKKGDIIEQTITINKGQVLIGGCNDMGNAHAFMKQGALSQYGVNIPHEVCGDLNNPGRFCAIATVDCSRKVRAKVNWVVENDVGITFEHGELKIIGAEDKDWLVIQEGTPEYQSSVAGMSDEELKRAIEGLRSTRATSTATYRTRKPSKAKIKAKTKTKGEKAVDKMSIEELKKMFGG